MPSALEASAINPVITPDRDIDDQERLKALFRGDWGERILRITHTLNNQSGGVAFEEPKKTDERLITAVDTIAEDGEPYLDIEPGDLEPGESLEL